MFLAGAFGAKSAQKSLRRDHQDRQVHSAQRPRREEHSHSRDGAADCDEDETGDSVELL
jgi:hypothetical protein